MKNKLLVLGMLVQLSCVSIANAQSVEPRTRAQVKQELSELEQVGYEPASDALDYPAGLEASERKLSTARYAKGEGQRKLLNIASKDAQ
ncbi:DUF4148 domain-containing protein [uncultured Caballeronia sp.]|uniref:DUF4148 domain-containing protein n=1 Tax=uncultured Caballeronia sp. TaxID=1827198 RepID=UPI0035CA3F59